MRAKQTLLIAIFGILTTTAIQAQDFWSDHFNFAPETAVFAPNELSADVFGFHASHNRNGTDTGTWGPGFGMNYFVTDYFGVGADTYADAWNHPYLLNGNALFRYPLLQVPGVAPYAFAGFGRQWAFSPQWLGDIGIGVEYRFTHSTAVFTDFRGVFAGNTSDYTLWRFGFRLVF